MGGIDILLPAADSSTTTIFQLLTR